jgi:hypothetical protein
MYTSASRQGVLYTWKTPHDTPHIASPHANTASDGAKTGMKIMTVIQTIKNIIVGRHPNRSCVYALTSSPTSWPTSAAFDNPACHAAVITFSPVAGAYTPNRF